LFWIGKNFYNILRWNKKAKIAALEVVLILANENTAEGRGYEWILITMLFNNNNYSNNNNNSIDQTNQWRKTFKYFSDKLM